ncbi:hypothetical protein NDU88_004261 [Pleurodeles waltl]|uniref:Uncharacterized protein n=1 Tax=Pleurodeles waltl TaxID=8319 RepID=A0AAV7SIB6_PLEWA|nr:hypothetical protein NDU88_004261 [Pleurodeles waltl]
MNVCDLVVEEGGEGLAQVLRWWVIVGAGAGFGEFLHDVEELLAVVCIVVKVVFEGGSLGRSDEFPARLLGGSEVQGEPAGSLAGASVGGFIKRGESVGAVVDPASEVAGCEFGVGGFSGWFSGEAGVQLVSADFVPVAPGDLLGAVLRGEFPEGEDDAAEVGPGEFGGVAEGDLGASGEDGVQRVASGVFGVVTSCLSPRVARLSIRVVELESLLFSR